jgi:DNA-binding GntR family transcriptional regulator
LSEIVSLSAPLGARVPTYKSAVYEQLQTWILELELPPGTRLVETDLSERLGVSKTPIREALLLLANDWLVELVPHQGATVTWLSRKEYVQLVNLLDHLEQPYLSTIVAQIDDIELREIGAMVSDLNTSRRAKDGRAYRDHLMLIHERLFAIPESPHLTRMIQWLGRLTRRYEVAFTNQFPEPWDIELRIVKERIAAIRRRDPDGARRAIESGHAELISLFEKYSQDPALAPYLRPSDDDGRGSRSR